MAEGSGPPPMTGVGNTKLSSAALGTAVDISNLQNKVALITGGSSGLGRAIAQAYAAAGAFVVNADVTPNPPSAPMLQDTLKDRDLTAPTVDLVNKHWPARDGHSVATFVHCDVTKAESVEAAVATAVKTYGRLDIMVNNAGIAAELANAGSGDTAAKLRTHEMDPSVMDRTWSINGRGVWLGIKYATAQMLQQPPHASGDRGWIINMASVLGLVGFPTASAYCASKGAVVQMTKTAALEYATDKIHINAVCPGFIETNMLEPMRKAAGSEGYGARMAATHPVGRSGLPEEIASAAVFLAGPGASFMTGTTLEVSGGYTAR